jgi:hypothetical protein
MQTRIVKKGETAGTEHIGAASTLFWEKLVYLALQMLKLGTSPHVG